MVDRLGHGVRELDVHPPMARIIQPSLDREQVDAIAAKHHMVNPMQTAGVCRDRERHG